MHRGVEVRMRPHRLVLEAFQRIRARVPEVLLIIAPRKPERFGEVVESDLKPGLHFKIPLVHEVRRFDVRASTAGCDMRPFRMERAAFAGHWTSGFEESRFEDLLRDVLHHAGRLAHLADLDLRGTLEFREVPRAVRLQVVDHGAHGGGVGLELGRSRVELGFDAFHISFRRAGLDPPFCGCLRSGGS